MRRPFKKAEGSDALLRVSVRGLSRRAPFEKARGCGLLKEALLKKARGNDALLRVSVRGLLIRAPFEKARGCGLSGRATFEKARGYTTFATDSLL